MKTGCIGCAGLVGAVILLSVVLTLIGARPPIRVDEQLEGASAGLRGAAGTLDPSVRPTPTARPIPAIPPTPTTVVVWIGTPPPR